MWVTYLDRTCQQNFCHYEWLKNSVKVVIHRSDSDANSAAHVNQLADKRLTYSSAIEILLMYLPIHALLFALHLLPGHL